MQVAGILRKSPSKKVEVSIGQQKEGIRARVDQDLGKDVKIDWIIDICEGDNEEGRVKLLKWFKKIKLYGRAYCLNVDRFSRGWLGLKWFHEVFLPNDCQLHFITEVPCMYDKEGKLIEEPYLFFFILCGFANYWLIKIRKGRKRGIERVKANPKLRAEKYKGGTKGRTWKCK